MEGIAARLRPRGVEAPGPSEPGDELLAACRRGDREALGRLFAETCDYVHGVALYMTRDEDLAGDLTQEVFLRVLTRIRQFEGRSAFRTWLFRITVNAARDQRRRRRPVVPLEEVAAALPEPAPSLETDLLARHRDARVRAALAALPHRLRLPLVLRYVAGLSYAEIGEVLALRPGTVASRLSRGLLRLARALPEEAR
jgi:RNA polymerase sigma-70 factor (ECF subfamily)